MFIQRLQDPDMGKSAYGTTTQDQSGMVIMFHCCWVFVSCQISS